MTTGSEISPKCLSPNQIKRYAMSPNIASTEAIIDLIEPTPIFAVLYMHMMYRSGRV